MLFEGALGSGRLAVLIVALVIACAFEFVNGFHDTANAVATVIYTRAMRPWTAVLWSGACNFCGVFVGGIAVAMSIMKLLPVELLVQSGTGVGLALVMSLLLAAILWNLGTWYFGLPASSSHTLIGAIIGVALANSLTVGHHFGDGVNLQKVREVALSLLLSPMFGFLAAGLLTLLLLKLLPRKELHDPPAPGSKPPGWVRAVLIGTCTGVSFAHGSNDGQKGVGLMMLILVGILPMHYALDPHAGAQPVARASAAAKALANRVEDLRPDGVETRIRLIALSGRLDEAGTTEAVPKNDRFIIRRQILEIDAGIEKLLKSGKLKLDKEAALQLKTQRADLRALTDYAPSWVLVLVALSLGLGTCIGWRRIVVTVGEKIGKAHLTYAQGASAELVAMSTIGVAALAGLPVSTTHVLSSGIAGTMVARGAGLQGRTVRNIALAWLLTLPATMLLGGTLFLVLRRLF